jgi:hypothetical protein
MHESLTCYVGIPKHLCCEEGRHSLMMHRVAAFFYFFSFCHFIALYIFCIFSCCLIRVTGRRAMCACHKRSSKIKMLEDNKKS